jgi:hypothetical protein
MTEVTPAARLATASRMVRRAVRMLDKGDVARARAGLDKLAVELMRHSYEAELPGEDGREHLVELEDDGRLQAITQDELWTRLHGSWGGTAP